jgi:hypothetical protein
MTGLSTLYKNRVFDFLIIAITYQNQVWLIINFDALWGFGVNNHPTLVNL